MTEIDTLVAWGLAESETANDRFRCELVARIDPDMPMPIPSQVLLDGPETFRATFYPVGGAPREVLCERAGPVVTLLHEHRPIGVTRVDMGYLYRLADLETLTRSSS